MSRVPRSRWLVASGLVALGVLALFGVRVPVVAPPRPPGPATVFISSLGAVPFTVVLNGQSIATPDPCNGGVELAAGDPRLPALPWSIVLARPGTVPVATVTVDRDQLPVYVQVRGDQAAITEFPLSGPPPDCLLRSAAPS